MQLLPESEYHRIRPLLGSVPFNTLFARAVLESHVAGRVYVDDLRAPRSCYVAHPYGMSLLFGSPASEGFRRSLAAYLTGESVDRSTAEWLQVFPNDWNSVLESIFGRRLLPGEGGRETGGLPTMSGAGAVVDIRVNFRFNKCRYTRLRESLRLPAECEVVDDVESIYSTMQGSVVPRAFWNSAADLRRRGAAFAVTWRGELASAAFASIAMDPFLELGIETVEGFRGRGLALHACSALIDHCLERRLQPVWACRLTNPASYRLATKLGFDHWRSLPYYRLPLSRQASAR